MSGQTTPTNRLAPLPDDEAQVERACNLVILAELITRWPALQRRLHQFVDGKSVLQRLADAACDDVKWEEALGLAGYDHGIHGRALGNLRELLRTYDGGDVARRATFVL